ncbi:hypothetical protein AVEN_264440-1 [Araneus ventricosus]|uniref:Uncharacterized protein n=1 Tax=Araneus ventricosus TaxID=182803 RepID=A0A4Y2QI56_ARAVE|nr:hypothetical protein AVEN_264440-1 [Araneus ventricosus]
MVWKDFIGNQRILLDALAILCHGQPVSSRWPSSAEFFTDILGLIHHPWLNPDQGLKGNLHDKRMLTEMIGWMYPLTGELARNSFGSKVEAASCYCLLRISPTMLSMKSFLVCLMVLALVSTTCRGDSFSMACATGPDGKMKCTQDSNPNGQSSSSFASSNGQAMSGPWRGLPYGR